MKCAVVLICFLSVSDAGSDVELNRPVPRLLTAGKFKKELKQLLPPKSEESDIRWEQRELREILTDIQDLFQISVLLDRRIDPNQKLNADLNEMPFQQGLESIAKSAVAEVQVIANTVYIGPNRSSVRLQKLVQARTAELVALSKEKRFPRGRHRKLAERMTLHWNDLDRPAGIIEQIAKRYKLKVNGFDQVPHDLWAHATLPGINSYEALTLVLFQFDLTFQWNNDASAIQIVPLPKE